MHKRVNLQPGVKRSQLLAMKGQARHLPHGGDQQQLVQPASLSFLPCADHAKQPPWRDTQRASAQTAFDTIAIIVLVPLYDWVLAPWLRWTYLRRIGWGLVVRCRTLCL